jgi:hypothetical protein
LKLSSFSGAAEPFIGLLSMSLSILAESKEQQKERCAVHLRPVSKGVQRDRQRSAELLNLAGGLGQLARRLLCLKHYFMKAATHYALHQCGHSMVRFTADVKTCFSSRFPVDRPDGFVPALFRNRSWNVVAVAAASRARVAAPWRKSDV